MGRKRLVSGACALAVAVGVVLAGTGTAQAEEVSWWTGVSPQASWHCNDTSGYYGSDIGWVYVQACVSANAPYVQGLYRLSFSQAHNNVSLTADDFVLPNGNRFPNGYVIQNSDRTCSSSVASGVTYTCFAHTEDVGGGNIWYGSASNADFVVDNEYVGLSYPDYGADQTWSPGVSWG